MPHDFQHQCKQEKRHNLIADRFIKNKEEKLKRKEFFRKKALRDKRKKT